MKRAQTAILAILLVSIPDIEGEGTPENMQKLLNAYIVGMGDLGARRQNQHLVVVFTKADELVTRFTAPWDDVRNYLATGALDGLAHPKGYMQWMHAVSARLCEFTLKELQAPGFINLAKRHFRSVTFSIISALGAKPSDEKLAVAILPRRILDPLLWMMEKSLPSWR